MAEMDVLSGKLITQATSNVVYTPMVDNGSETMIKNLA